MCHPERNAEAQPEREVEGSFHVTEGKLETFVAVYRSGTAKKLKYDLNTTVNVSIDVCPELGIPGKEASFHAEVDEKWWILKDGIRFRQD